MAPEITITKLDTTHAKRVLDMLVNSFTFEEPTNRAVELTPEQSRPCYEELVRDSLTDDCSFVALDDGKLVGYRLNTIYRRHNTKDGDNAGGARYPPTHMLVLNLLDMLSADADRLLAEKTGEDAATMQILKFEVVHVEESHRRCGIANALIERSIDYARANAFDWIVTTPTSCKSQALFDKMGFFVLREIAYDDAVFKRLPAGETRAKLMAIKL